MQGIFVTFEGTEGAGKSTLIREFAKLLEEKGYRVTITREPGGSPLAEEIRAILLNKSMTSWTELFLYEASRAEHLHQVIKPGLNRGEVVLCDRFTDSTLAYQAFARGLPWKEVKTVNRLATEGLDPDLTFLLDIDPELGLRRAVVQNRFEAEGVEFQTRVRKGFLKSRAENPKRWSVIKVENKNPEALAYEAWLAFEKKLVKKSKKKKNGAKKSRR